ncbi:hypothetical protein [Enterobacter cloacae complex sp. 288G10]|uniref:hypothetical protein n=1 Tax=Enterobacter cloacae complex sp. 288G10 TaxID=3395859 RepID=UPI003CFA7929
MRPAPLRPAAVAAPAQPQRYLTNDEAAEYLRLSPRTLEKKRVIGGGPKFRKFGRRVMYAVSPTMPGPTSAATRRLPTRNMPNATRAITVMAADRWRVGGRRHVQPAREALQREQLDLFRALPGDMAPRDSQDLMAFPFFSRRSRGVPRRSTSAPAASPSAWRVRRSTASQRYGMPTC